MDASNTADVEGMRPSGSQTPVRQLMEFAPEAGVNEVPDPYYTRNFDEAIDLIELGIAGLIQAVSEGKYRN